MSHISLVAVTARERSSSTEGQQAARSGCAIGNGDLFSEDDPWGVEKGDGIVVFVIPVYDMRDAWRPLAESSTQSSARQ